MIWNRYPQPNLSFLNFIKCAKIDRMVHLPRSVVLVFFLTFNSTIFKLCSTKNHMWLYFCHIWWFNFSFLANDGSIVTLGSTNITFDRTVLTFGGTFVRMEPPNVKKKSKGTTKCDKRTVTCDVGTAQCEDEFVKYEEK